MLTLSVAEWGVGDVVTGIIDPAKKHWTGPPFLGGKHLMSYTAGGIGIPHLDTDGAVKFFDHLSGIEPGAKAEADYLRSLGRSFQYDSLRARGICRPDSNAAADSGDGGEAFPPFAAKYYSGKRYCATYGGLVHPNFTARRDLQKWARVGLRRREMQEWVITTWVQENWLPVYTAVMSQPHGSLEEAFIIARIHNSAPGTAVSALRAAGTEADPARRIQAELTSYAAGNTKVH